jgi:hypothetical protein
MTTENIHPRQATVVSTVTLLKNQVVERPPIQSVVQACFLCEARFIVALD